MRKTLLLYFFFIHTLIHAQFGSITAGNDASVTLPNLTTTQITAITNPKHGSMVYDTSEKTVKVFDGISWKSTSQSLNGLAPTPPSNAVNAITITPSTDGNVGLPQLNDSQIKAINNPQKGSVVYDVTAGCVRYFDGEIWRCSNQWKMNYPEEITAWKPSSSNGFRGSVAIDNEGNILMFGTFTNTISFGGTTLNAGGLNQIFLVKYTPTGSVIWAKTFTASNYAQAGQIKVDAEGNIYISGEFTFTMNLDANALVGNEYRSLFVAKLSNSGNTIWAKRISGDRAVYGGALKLDKQNNVLITGIFNTNNIYFTTSAIILASGSNDTGFLAKCNTTTGNFEWAKAFATTDVSDISNATVDTNNNVYVVGHFSGTMNLPNSTSITAAGLVDVFVGKYDVNGAFQWAIREGTGSFETAKTIDFLNGKLLVTGYTEGATNIGGFDLYTFYVNSGAEAFFGKLDANTHTWDWVAKADGYTYLTDATLTADNKFYLSGSMGNYLTKFGSKSIWANAGSSYLVKGDFLTGNVLYLRKFASVDIQVSTPLPLSGSKKLISGTTPLSNTFGNGNLNNPSGNFQSFIGIITE
jgi:hypothetical protein